MLHLLYVRTSCYKVLCLDFFQIWIPTLNHAVCLCTFQWAVFHSESGIHYLTCCKYRHLARWVIVAFDSSWGSEYVGNRLTWQADFQLCGWSTPRPPGNPRYRKKEGFPPIFLKEVEKCRKKKTRILILKYSSVYFSPFYSDAWGSFNHNVLREKRQNTLWLSGIS